MMAVFSLAILLHAMVVSAENTVTGGKIDSVGTNGSFELSFQIEFLSVHGILTTDTWTVVLGLNYEIRTVRVVSNGIYAGQGADSSVALIRDTGEKMYRSGMTEYVTVKGYVKAVNPPYDLNITLLCYVGVDRCTEDSTAASLPADGANQDTNTQEFPTADEDEPLESANGDTGIAPGQTTAPDGDTPMESGDGDTGIPSGQTTTSDGDTLTESANDDTGITSGRITTLDGDIPTESANGDTGITSGQTTPPDGDTPTESADGDTGLTTDGDTLTESANDDAGITSGQTAPTDGQGVESPTTDSSGITPGQVAPPDGQGVESPTADNSGITPGQVAPPDEIPSEIPGPTDVITEDDPFQTGISISGTSLRPDISSLCDQCSDANVLGPNIQNARDLQQRLLNPPVFLRDPVAESSVVEIRHNLVTIPFMIEVGTNLDCSEGAVSVFLDDGCVISTDVRHSYRECELVDISRQYGGFLRCDYKCLPLLGSDMTFVVFTKPSFMDDVYELWSVAAKIVPMK